VKATRIHQHGGIEQLKLEEVSQPQPKPNEVLVKVKAISLNHLDLWVRQGVAGHAYPLPIIPGCDIAGIVESTGQSTLVSPGVSCRTCKLCLTGQEQLCRYYGVLGETQDGGCAEYLAVPTENLLPFPEGYSFEEAACLPLVFLTAWHMLVSRAHLQAGEDVLIHAGGSGVSSAAIQIAKHFQARVITTVGSPDKAEKAKQLGADHIILYHDQDFLPEVKKFTGKRGVDIVMDHIGLETWERSVKSLAKGGRLITCGVTSGHTVSTDLRYLFFKGLSYLGSTMGNKAELLEVLKLVQAKKLHPVMDRIFPWSRLGEAHLYLESRRHFGKVAVTIS